MSGADAPTRDVTPDGERSFPCAPAQVRLYRRARAAPADPSLNVALRWEIEGRATGEDVARALAAVVARHETLRTRLVEEAGASVQRVAETAALRFSCIDLTGLPQAEREARACAIAEEEARTPIALDAAPLHRQTLLTFAPDRAWLLLTFHHVIFDAGSIDVFHRDFSAALDAVVTGGGGPQSPLALHYGDYAAWTKALEDSGAFEEDRLYWRERLADCPAFGVDGDLAPAPAAAFRAAGIVAALLDEGTGEAMERRARALGMTAFAFNAAALAAALAIWTGHDDVVFTTQVAGRDEIETEPLIGLFVNDVVLRFDVRRDRDVASFARAANDVVLEALAHGRLPASEVAALFEPQRAPEAPLAAVNFMLLGKTRSQTGDGAARVLRRASVAAPAAQFDLNFFMVHWPAGWRLALEYDATRFSPERAQALLETWRSALTHAARDDGALEGIETALAPSLPAPVGASAVAARLGAEERRAAAAAPDWFQITPICVCPGGPTLFVVNNAIAYVDVAARLDDAYSIVAVQLFHPDQPHPLAPRTMQEIAADYVRLIRTRQKRGPYRLAGLCVSAVIAYECARQLEAAGEEVALLALLDCVAPGSIAALPFLPRQRFKWTRRASGLKRNWRRWRKGAPLAEVLLNYRVFHRTALGDLLRASLRRRGLPPPPEDVVLDRWFLPHFEAARAAYRPKDAHVAAPAVALYSDLLQTRFCRDGAGWKRYLAGPLTVGFAAGWHADMLREGGETIAAAIRRADGR